MGKKIGAIVDPHAGGKARKDKEEEEKREKREAAARAAAQAAAEAAEKERLDKQRALEAEETKRRKGARYGKRGMPINEYLLGEGTGSRKTILGG